jgi:hypothetical protein
MVQIVKKASVETTLLHSGESAVKVKYVKTSCRVFSKSDKFIQNTYSISLVE